MRVNKKIILGILFITSLFVLNTNIKAFHVYDAPGGESKKDDIVTDEYGNSLKYDANSKLYFCTQPDKAWPSNCDSYGDFGVNVSGALTYLIRRYNEDKISYSAVQRMASKLIYKHGSTTGRADENLSKILTKDIDINATKYYEIALRVYNNDTQVTYLKNGTDDEITKLEFPTNEDGTSKSNQITISYSLPSPFGLQCKVDDNSKNNGVTVSVDHDNNKKITIDTKGYHTKALVSLSCRTYYNLNTIRLFYCTGQDIMRLKVNADYKGLEGEKEVIRTIYGPWKTITSIPYYTVKYHSNTEENSTIIESKPVVKGTEITIKSNDETKFENDGKVFNNWVVKRKQSSPDTWYVSGRGWLTSDQISTGNYKKKFYYPGNNHTLQGAWIKNSKGEITNDFYTFIFFAKWLKDNGVLKIKKVNSQGDPILEKSVSFDIFTSADCNASSKKQSVTIHTGGDGTDEIELEPGNYYITETRAPSKEYSKDAIKCMYAGKVEAGKTIEVVVTNTNQCDADLQNNSTTAGRLKLYRENYQTFNNLLDFNKTTSVEACNNTEYTLDSSNSCLSVKRTPKASDTFDHTNLSAYNDTLYYNNKTHYCLTQYTLNGSLGNTVTSGQFLSTNNVLSKGTFTKTCYIHKDEVGDVPSKIVTNDLLKNYIGEALLGEKVLNNNYESSKIIYKRIDGNYGDFYKYEYSKNVEYYSWNVYATIGKAEVMYDDCSNCKYLGKGVISSFSSEVKIVDLPFRITEPSVNSLKINGQSNCQYRAVPEITDENELQLEFRPIDTKEPFNRNANSNWCIINDGNKDCTSNNKIITDTIINKTNSYGMNNGVKQTPKYTIRLSSSDITNIREYNKNSSGYDDYETMEKDDNGKIRSTFLTGLKDGRFGSKLIVR